MSALGFGPSSALVILVQTFLHICYAHSHVTHIFKIRETKKLHFCGLVSVPTKRLLCPVVELSEGDWNMRVTGSSVDWSTDALVVECAVRRQGLVEGGGLMNMCPSSLSLVLFLLSLLSVSLNWAAFLHSALYIMMLLPQDKINLSSVKMDISDILSQQQKSDWCICWMLALFLSTTVIWGSSIYKTYKSKC